MKLQKQISSFYSKTISAFLLLYFVLSPLLNALPHQECNGSCMMETMNCNTMMDDMKDECCNVNSFNELNPNIKSGTCDIKIDNFNCMIVKDLSSINSFVVTQKFQPEQDFSIISTINPHTNNFEFVLFDLQKTIKAKGSPPIYLFIQSFLI